MSGGTLSESINMSTVSRRWSDATIAKSDVRKIGSHYARNKRPTSSCARFSNVWRFGGDGYMAPLPDELGFGAFAIGNWMEDRVASDSEGTPRFMLAGISSMHQFGVKQKEL